MARTTFVKSARERKEGNPPYHCVTCGQDIEPGQSYYWNQPSRFSPRFNWHAGCTAPPASRLESNEKRSTAMGHFEGAYKSLDDIRSGNYVEMPESPEESGPDVLIEDLKQVINDLAEGMDEVAGMYRDSQDNMESTFEHSTEGSDQQGEWADEYDSMKSDIEDVANELDAWDPESGEDFDDWVDGVIESVESGFGDVEGNMP